MAIKVVRGTTIGQRERLEREARLLASFEEWWSGLATWNRLEPEQQRALIQAIDRAYKGKLAALGEARDKRLSALLRALEQARTEV